MATKSLSQAQKFKKDLSAKSLNYLKGDRGLSDLTEPRIILKKAKTFSLDNREGGEEQEEKEADADMEETRGKDRQGYQEDTPVGSHGMKEGS
eukprot:CAMPEP_0204917458 /NCGR_PEP_ID=MMETSP1397-20131031/15055_1 /ASSEMBLY_ACC=CAM_ASM_000891 /TAXON_ID=49980 /ORGANISM="Climacostomum Climacostomum virens, Strain Stock W-24" /LENGTH=92 /DNA_ID=CAMNT_0052090293 /DNA_START=92 /DNA_END=366 /DNA_ORIENTATION=-